MCLLWKIQASSLSSSSLQKKGNFRPCYSLQLGFLMNYMYERLIKSSTIIHTHVQSLNCKIVLSTSTRTCREKEKVRKALRSVLIVGSNISDLGQLVVVGGGGGGGGGVVVSSLDRSEARWFDAQTQVPSCCFLRLETLPHIVSLHPGV